MKEHETFCDSILQIYDLPDMKSYRHAIATMIMHESPTSTRKSKIYFARCIQKAMANQIAYEMIQKYKEAEKSEIEVLEPVNETPL